MRERRRETQMTRLARETRKTDETRNARLTRGDGRDAERGEERCEGTNNEKRVFVDYLREPPGERERER